MPDKAITPGIQSRNPFTPDFGKVPTYFAGREDVLSELTDTFEHVNSMGTCALFVGPRGSGKTALLTYIGSIAEQFGWVVANVSSLPGMLEDILQQGEASAQHIVNGSASKRLKGIGVAGIGSVQWESERTENPTWRTQMTRFLDALDEAGVGLVITVDEVDVTLPEMTELVSVYQHFVREDRKVALLMAGLPYNVDTLIKGKNTSFMRRAERYDLGPLNDYEVEEAFKLTIENGGKIIDDHALKTAVKAIHGFPFMLQLLGHRAWRLAGESPSLSLDAVQKGAELAQKQLKTRIFDTTYAELSPADRNFLKAMLQDECETSRADLMNRLGKPSGHIATYKRRLTQAGVIDETLRGTFRFSLPGFKEYLRTIES